jgi:hypothetical protein
MTRIGIVQNKDLVWLGTPTFFAAHPSLSSISNISSHTMIHHMFNIYDGSKFFSFLLPCWSGVVVRYKDKRQMAGSSETGSHKK